MIENLVNSAKGELSSRLQSEAGISGGKIDQTMDLAKDSIFDGLKQQALGGNLSGILDLFNGKEQVSEQNPIVSSISGIFQSKLTEKLGFSGDKAGSLSSLIIPFIMKKFGDKQSGEAQDEASLMKMLGMDGDSAISGLLNNFKRGKGDGLLGSFFG